MAYSPKCCPIYTKASPVMHLIKPKTNEFLAQRTFRFTFSLRYKIVVSFISIAFSKFCVPIQHPRNNPFWEVFGPLLEMRLESLFTQGKKSGWTFGISSFVLNVRTSFLTLCAESQVTCEKITRIWSRPMNCELTLENRSQKK